MNNLGDWIVGIVFMTFLVAGVSGLTVGLLSYDTGKSNGYRQCYEEILDVKENKE